MSTETVGRWVLYKRKDGEFVFLSKPLKTKKQAEQEQLRLNALPENRRTAIGVGFVRTVAPRKK